MTKISGHIGRGWGAVADAFRRNFECHGELGAACCVYDGGHPVVDLWGGIADQQTGRPWEEDTIVVVNSTTKGATAICAHMLAGRGELDLDAPVVRYWPEFGEEGKGETRVRWLLSHQAGLPEIDGTLTLEEACAWEPVIRALEKQKPVWEPGTQQAYHPLTYGFLIGEVVRRITGKTIGRYFADNLAGPLNLSSWIGLGEELEPRVAPLVFDPTLPDWDAILDKSFAQLAETILVPAGARSTLKAIWSDPNPYGMSFGSLGGLGGAFAPTEATEPQNTRIVHASEHPGSGMISDARSLARMYAATIGEVDGIRLLTPSTVETMCTVEPAIAYGIPPDLQAFMRQAFPSFPTGLSGIHQKFLFPTPPWSPILT